MNRLNASWILAIVLSLWTCVGTASAVTAVEIDAAIAKAQEFLYGKQENGNWELQQTRDTSEYGASLKGGQWGGLTALSTYALLASGQSPQDPRLEPAIKWLLDNKEMVGIYALGMRAQIWQFLPKSKDVQEAVKRDRMLLIRGVRRTGHPGLYDYTIAPGDSANIDTSVSQYGVLGVWATALMGEEIPSEYWAQVEKTWLEIQQPEGGWAYRGAPFINDKENHPINVGLTAAGVATLFITQEFVHANAGLECAGSPSNPAIEKGLKWITDNFTKAYEEGPYSLYGIERIGVASGHKYLGNIDWYQAGAAELVQSQNADGSWTRGLAAPVAPTALGLLFLSRGRAPVVMNKLDYAPQAGSTPEPPPANPRRNARRPDASLLSVAEGVRWNQRPRDVAHVVRWIGREAERDLNWQIVNLQVDPDEWHDAPILYIAGSGSLKFDADQIAKLRKYVDGGGLILLNADCGDKSFVGDAKALGTAMFPDYEWAELPADHPVYTNQQFRRDKWRTKPSVLAISNGARLLVVLLPTADAGKAWQTKSDRSRLELFQLASNLYFYAVDRQGGAVKGRSHVVPADSRITPSRNVRVARIRYHGNWNPEPGGWTQLAAVMRNRDLIDMQTGESDLSPGSLDGFAAAHLTGTAGFDLKPEQRAELKRFVDAGGVLLVDSAGGAADFSIAADRLLREMFPEQAAALNEPLPLNKELYAKASPPIKEVGYRSFARASTVGTTLSPRLRGMEINAKPAVFFSPEDLSVGLVGQPVDGILGYDPASATAIVRAILTPLAK